MSETQHAEAAPLVAKAPLAQLVVAVLALTLSAAGFGALLFVEMAAEKLAIMAGFVGLAFGWAGGVMQFYFGQTLGSQSRDTAVNKLLGR